MTSGGVNSIKNCTLDSNNVIAISTFNDSILNCSIRYNGAGIQAGSLTVISGNDIEYNSSTNISCGSGITSISGNTIRFGQIGISSTITGTLTITKNIIEDNELGIDLNTSSASISCNKICSNTTYDFKYGASSNLDAGHNFWCTADSTSTEAVIYDGYDNINYGLVSFMPLDSECYLETAVSEIEVNSPVTIYPNPFSLQTIIRPGRAFHNATLFLFNISGQQVKKLENISGPDITLSRDTLPAGLYFMQLMQDDKALIKKLMISDN
jgi:hypothetical protein